MRKTIIILLSCTILLLLGYSAYRSYEVWKQRHWMAMAKEFAARQDGHNEFLCLEQVLQLNPANVEACRMLADLAQASGSQSALTERKKVLELDPNSLDDRLALAKTALLFHDYGLAQSTLDGVDAAGKKSAPYFNVAGQLAITENNAAGAKADFAQAIQLAPSDPVPQLNLAAIELAGTNALDAAQARIILQRINTGSTNVEARIEADRDLISDALHHKNNDAALSLSKELAGLSASFPDKLLRLDVLKLANSDQYQPLLASCEGEAANKPDELPRMSLWLLQRRMTGQALAWLQSLPANTRTNLPAALLLAECQMLMQDWSPLQNSISKENWGNQEFVRQAFLARALRQQGLYEASKAQWDVALKSANSRDDYLTALYRFTTQWNWQDESQQILWAIVNNFSQEQWAQQQLAVLLYSTGSTRPLMELFSMEANHNPSDLQSKNNLALTAMLLHAQEMDPYNLARQVFQQAPTNSFYACTYAFSLHLQGKDAEALKIMRQIDPQQLKDKSTAGYYGIILKATGNSASANAYLRRALKGQLLPEERAIFQQSLSGT